MLDSLVSIGLGGRSRGVDLGRVSRVQCSGQKDHIFRFGPTRLVVGRG